MNAQQLDLEQIDRLYALYNRMMKWQKIGEYGAEPRKIYRALSREYYETLADVAGAIH
jgi:hypothetical protein